MSITSFFAKLETQRNKESYEKALKQSLQSAIMTHLLFGSSSNTDMPIIEHPLHKQRIRQAATDCAEAPRTKKLSINFGDSLTDLARPYFKNSLDVIMSVSGSYANHMEQMAVETRHFLTDHDVEYVFVGTLGGNPMLVYRDYQQVVSSSKKCLDTVRSLYPRQKIIIYTLPPVFNLNATNHAYLFTMDMLDWAAKDKRACVIDMHRVLGSGPFNLFPKSQWSSDGVHLTPAGAVKLSLKFNQAKTSSDLLVA